MLWKKPLEYDFIIIGSGIAGLYSAILASELGKVLILTKGSLDECNTKYAQGGIAAPIGKDDSPELHFRDTIAAGAGLCDPEAVEVLVEEASDRILDLVRLGVRFDTLEGEIALTREAAHSVPRVLHAGGDATGEMIETTLGRRVRERENITIIEYSLVTELLVRDGKIYGVRALDCLTNMVDEYRCKYVILATGGSGRLFKFTTNPEVATGDGVALAYRAGAEIMDMEFFQFHPTALRLPGVPAFLITEAVRGEGGVLINEDGEPFMKKYHPLADLAPRDVVSRAILKEMERGKVYLDLSRIPSSRIIARFPHIYKFCLEHSIDITKEPIPVAPAAHYMIGGVRTNLWGETNIEGLFACGEVAATGVHGANRLASNSLLETVVFSKRIMERIKRGSGRAEPSKEHFKLKDHGEIKKPLSLSSLQELMWEKVGIERSGDGLLSALRVLKGWEGMIEPRDRPSWELYNMILTGRLMAEAALIREESRGTHFRVDFPNSSPDWQKHIVFRKDG